MLQLDLSIGLTAGREKSHAKNTHVLTADLVPMNMPMSKHSGILLPEIFSQQRYRLWTYKYV